MRDEGATNEPPAHAPVQRLNEHHTEDLLVVARALGDHPDATTARAERIGSAGVDLVIDTRHGRSRTHVDFVEPATGDRELRLAFRAVVAVARATITRSEGIAP